MQQNLAAKTPQFKEDAAHRPEVRFYPIHSSVSGGEKRRNGGRGDNPATSAILDETFDQNLWSNRTKHKIVMQRNTVNTLVFAHRRGRDAEAQKARKIRGFGTPKTTNGRPTSIETIQKHVVFTTRDNEKRRGFWPQMVPNEAI